MKLANNFKTPYYTKIPIFSLATLKGSLFKTYCFILSTSKTKDGTCKLGYKEIARLMNCKSATTVNGYLSKLKDLQFISIIPGTGLNGERGKNNSGFRNKSYRPTTQPFPEYVMILS